MRLKLFRAASVTQAMALVRNELGPEALILSTRRIGQGVELTAALESAEPPLAAAEPLLSASVQAGEVLRFHAVPEDIVDRLRGQGLAAGLAGIIRFEALPLSDGPAPLLLTGAPGAGKTLSVARLATRLVMGGTAPMIVTTDGKRAGAAEQLAAFTRLLGIGLIAATTPQALSRALQARVPGVPVLIDTAGLNPFLVADIDGMRALAETSGATIILVAQAGLDAAEAAEQATVFAQAGARFLLPTRLDIARRLGSVLTAASHGRLALSEAGIGPGATSSLETLTADTLAARLLESAAANAPTHNHRKASHGRS